MEEIRAEAEVDQPQHCKGACLYYGHRVEQGAHRGRSHRGIRQPAVEGKDGRFHAEAEKRCGEYQQQCVLLPRHQIGIQYTAIGEVQMPHAIVEQKHQPDEGKGRTGKGVDHVFAPGIPCLFIHGVHHQGQRRQRQQLIKEI